jgi:hypothetical protein
MAFTGEVEFVDGRAPSKTAAMVLRRCLGCGQEAAEAAIEAFLRKLSIKPSAFFADIDDSWADKPYLGQHVYKTVLAAGYGGTENDLWLAVTDHAAPYRTTKPKRETARKAKKAK